MNIKDIDAKAFAEMISEEWLAEQIVIDADLMNKVAEISAVRDCAPFLMWTAADKFAAAVTGCQSCLTRQHFLTGFLTGIKFTARAVEVEQLQKLHDLNPEAKS